MAKNNNRIKNNKKKKHAHARVTHRIIKAPERSGAVTRRPAGVIVPTRTVCRSLFAHAKRTGDAEHGPGKKPNQYYSRSSFLFTGRSTTSTDDKRSTLRTGVVAVVAFRTCDGGGGAIVRLVSAAITQDIVSDGNRMLSHWISSRRGTYGAEQPCGVHSERLQCVMRGNTKTKHICTYVQNKINYYYCVPRCL